MFLERYDPLKQEMVCILAPDGSCNETLRPAMDKQQGTLDVPPDVIAAPLRP